jgi:hypothetical protein
MSDARPAFQFYPGDWLKSVKLRRCSWAARAVWIDVLCYMHDSDEYGVLRWPLKEIAHTTGAKMRELKELVEKGVLYGTEKGQCEPLIYVPKSGRKLGAPVELIAVQNGPIWYSPRMVRDEYVRRARAAGGQFGSEQNPAPKGGLGDGYGGDFDEPPNQTPNPGQSDGASTSSSSSYYVGNSSTSTETEEGEGVPPLPVDRDEVIGMAKALRALGMNDVTPSRVELLQLVAAGATVEQAVDTALELKARKPGNPVPKLNYLAATLMGRASDFNLSQGNFDAAGQTGRGDAGGRQAPKNESVAARAERKRREADARDEELEQQGQSSGAYAG